MPLTKAFLALGSNLGDRLGNLQAAIRGMEAGGDLIVVRSSQVYENRAVGMGEDAVSFFNSVIEIRTSLDPQVLLERGMSVEEDLGRVRTGSWAPRTIDIDILLYGTVELVEPDLILPHPRIIERDFVLKPLHDLIPDFQLEGRTICEHLESLEVIDLVELPLRLWPLGEVNMIAACSENRIIGMDGGLPWSISEDWEVFLRKTVGGVLVMGRLSFLEMLKEPSWRDDRKYIVLTSQPALISDFEVSCVFDFNDAITQGKERARANGTAVWICGGEAIYKRAMQCSDQLHLTLIHRDAVGDTRLPEWESVFSVPTASASSSGSGELYTFKVFET